MDFWKSVLWKGLRTVKYARLETSVASSQLIIAFSGAMAKNPKRYVNLNEPYSNSPLKIGNVG